MLAIVHLGHFLHIRYGIYNQTTDNNGLWTPHAASALFSPPTGENVPRCTCLPLPLRRHAPTARSRRGRDASLVSTI